MTAPYTSFVPASNSRRPKPRPAASSHRSTAPRTAGAEPLDNVTRVYTELRALIIAGQLPPGARIAERAVVAVGGGKEGREIHSLAAEYIERAARKERLPADQFMKLLQVASGGDR